MTNENEKNIVDLLGEIQHLQPIPVGGEFDDNSHLLFELPKATINGYRARTSGRSVVTTVSVNTADTHMADQIARELILQFGSPRSTIPVRQFVDNSEGGLTQIGTIYQW